MKVQRSVLEKAAILVFLGFAFLNLGIVVLNHYYFRTYALDYAIYNFAFFDYAHFRITPCPAYIFPFPVTFIQDHFSLTLIFLAPLYWVLSPLFGTYALLILQWVFILAGAYGSYKFIFKKSKDGFLALCGLVYYFVLFGRFSAYREDVNLAIFGSALIPVFIYFFDQGKTRAAVITFVALLLNREDYALWLSFISLFFIVHYWRDLPRRKLGFIFLGCSVLFFILLFSVIIPALEDENKKYALFDFTAVGETPAKAFAFMISHPIDAIRLLFVNHGDSDYYDGIKQNFYIVYLVSGGLLIFLRPWLLIPFIPILAKKMYDDNPLRWSIEHYYSIEFVSIMPVFVFMVIMVWKNQALKHTTAVLVCALTAGMTVYKMLVPPPNPIVGESNKYNIVHPDFYKPIVDVKDVNEVLDIIPSDAAVSGGARLIPHLAYREKVYYFPNVRDAEYVVLFKKEDYYPLSKEDYEREITVLSSSADWLLAQDRQDVLLFKRKQKTGQ